MSLSVSSININKLNTNHYKTSNKNYVKNNFYTNLNEISYGKNPVLIKNFNNLKKISNLKNSISKISLMVTGFISSILTLIGLKKKKEEPKLSFDEQVKKTILEFAAKFDKKFANTENFSDKELKKIMEEIIPNVRVESQKFNKKMIGSYDFKNKIIRYTSIDDIFKNFPMINKEQAKDMCKGTLCHELFHALTFDKKIQGYKLNSNKVDDNKETEDCFKLFRKTFEFSKNHTQMITKIISSKDFDVKKDDYSRDIYSIIKKDLGNIFCNFNFSRHFYKYLREICENEIQAYETELKVLGENHPYSENALLQISRYECYKNVFDELAQEVEKMELKQKS